jgi:hypothetical protein
VSPTEATPDLEAADRLLAVVMEDGVERRRLVELMRALTMRPGPPPESAKLFPRWAELLAGFTRACRGRDPEALEEAFLELYAHLHMHEALYTPDERRRVDSSGGYWTHAGGLSSILRAGPYLGPTGRSVDLGAGNGLQGLLLQRLSPHARCCQIEISSDMVEIGKALQRWLDIPDDRVEWRAEDVTTTALGGWDFVYLYRPVRPEGPGRAFYRRLAGALEAEPGEVVVFSIADCLDEFLPPVFERFFSDGHLTCYRKNATDRSGG